MIRCRVVGHRPYIDDSQAWKEIAPHDFYSEDGELVPEGAKISGPIRRYCGRCGITLPGDMPELGDRRKLA